LEVAKKTSGGTRRFQSDYHPLCQADDSGPPCETGSREEKTTIYSIIYHAFLVDLMIVKKEPNDQL